MEKTIYKWDAETILAAKKAAVAMAEFWDAMGAEEGDKNKSFDNTIGVIEYLASACGTSTSIGELDDETVTDALNYILEEE